MIKSVTISKTKTGKYYASVLVDTKIDKPIKQPVQSKTTVGIDVGVKHLAILSTEEKIENPKYYKKALSYLKYLQRKYAKYGGKRTLKKLQLQYEKIANQRKDNLHKVSSKIISENQTIILEDLNIKGMTSRIKPKQDESGKYLPNGQSAKSALNKSINDAAWRIFIDMLIYKADWYGINVIKIGRFEPSSKKCNICKAINKDLKLSDRSWQCETCGAIHDRDINAAINIKQIGLKNHCLNNIRSAERMTENHKELFPIGKALTCEVHQ